MHRRITGSVPSDNAVQIVGQDGRLVSMNQLLVTFSGEALQLINIFTICSAMGKISFLAGKCPIILVLVNLTLCTFLLLLEPRSLTQLAVLMP